AAATGWWTPSWRGGTRRRSGAGCASTWRPVRTTCACRCWRRTQRTSASRSWRSSRRRSSKPEVGVQVDLSGRTALVTGAAVGIGRATAQLLASAGARVVVADLDGEAALAAAGSIEEAGGVASGAELDVRDPDGA